MDKHAPWWPKLKNAPLFNPFEAPTEWTAELGDADRIDIEEDEETADNRAPDSATGQVDEK